MQNKNHARRSHLGHGLTQDRKGSIIKPSFVRQNLIYGLTK